MFVIFPAAQLEHSPAAIAVAPASLQFLGAVTKLRKATVSFVIYFRQPAWNNSTPTARIFMKFDILNFFESLSRKFKFY
jgi:hypothetical protein